jgi:hypothetical protein
LIASGVLTESLIVAALMRRSVSGKICPWSKWWSTLI